MEQTGPKPAAISRRDVLVSYGDGSGYSLMVGFGETYFAAFALAVGLGQVTAGLLGSIPLIAGGLLQLIAPWGARRLGTYRRWVVVVASGQGLVFIPLAAAALAGTMSSTALFGLAAIYWALGMSAGPAWNNWIDAIVPRAALKDFIAIRARVTQCAALIAFVAGGTILSQMTSAGLEHLGFAAIFALAGLSRAASAVCLGLQTCGGGPREVVAAGERAGLLRALRRYWPGAGGAAGQTKSEPDRSSSFLTFLVLSQVAINIGGPFFAPYLLGQRKLPYFDYSVAVAAAFVAKVIMFPYAGRLVGTFGAARALRWGAVAIAPLPLAWAFTANLPILIMVQVFGGAAWAVYELAATLLIFDHVPRGERLHVLTLNNLLNAGAMVIGSLIGGGLLKILPPDGAYLQIFLLSAVARVATLLLLERRRPAAAAPDLDSSRPAPAAASSSEPTPARAA